MPYSSLYYCLNPFLNHTNEESQNCSVFTKSSVSNVHYSTCYAISSMKNSLIWAYKDGAKNSLLSGHTTTAGLSVASYGTKGFKTNCSYQKPSNTGHVNSAAEIHSNSDKLSHVDNEGKVKMVDVGSKDYTERRAVATGKIWVGKEVLRLIEENNMKKGDVLTTAQLAGIMGAKHTSLLIPLCHPISLTSVKVSLRIDADSASIIVSAEAKTVGKTGVEMEALTAVSVAALTVYDMCKAVTHEMVISDVQLVKKSGGKRDYQRL